MIPISVIVPIYNMEELMRKCLDSILAQTFKDYECLLVDDGSTDGSPAICDEYAAKDSRFKAFHKPNGGLSDARNFGLAHARGEYTIFFDPDDWVDEDCLNDMYAKAAETGSDMVMCDYFNEDPYSVQYIIQRPSSLKNVDVIKDLLLNKINGFTWNKLLKNSLYYTLKLQYPQGIYGREDIYTMCSLLKNDISISYLPKAYYHYMHYGNNTESRKYDENTYNHDLTVRDMFTMMMKNTEFEQLSYDVMSYDAIYRAFFFGKKQYSSKMFKERFGDYTSIVKTYGGRMKYLLLLSIGGLYRPCRNAFQIGYNIKQILKKLI